ncbi:hypothetical protein KIW84_011396 [Lathyrus oleraceus]|uniref:Retroviral polymerase SH3-like domain-containing protein n=1 Tax=Pisum sativum TaxID=3888 RepID=A0A9D5GUV9_PEA|nr:hypothetical protein KIW84_011396 [Pisum sativum]
MWNFSVQHVVHIINRLPSPLLNLKCPYELLYKQPPSLVHLKVFGCLSYATTLQAHRTKFDSRARKVVFLGFKDGTKEYILYDLSSHDIFVSRNVVFYETYFPFQNSKPIHNASGFSKPIPSNFVLDDPVSNTPDSLPLPVMIEPDCTSPNYVNIEYDPIVSSPTSSSHTPLSASSHDSPNLTTLPSHDNLRKSTRTIIRPSYLEDYHCYSATGSANNNNLF